MVSRIVPALRIDIFVIGFPPSHHVERVAPGLIGRSPDIVCRALSRDIASMGCGDRRVIGTTTQSPRAAPTHPGPPDTQLAIASDSRHLDSDAGPERGKISQT